MSSLVPYLEMEQLGMFGNVCGFWKYGCEKDQVGGSGIRPREKKATWSIVACFVECKILKHVQYFIILF